MESAALSAVNPGDTRKELANPPYWTPRGSPHQRTIGANFMITPLRKCTAAGLSYTRPHPIEVLLAELHGLSPEDLVARCEIRDRNDAAYVPSECLVHLVRARKADNSDALFERLYKFLAARILQALPNPDSRQGNKIAISLTKSRIREKVFDRFIEILASDRAGYDDRLDYFEIRFDGALANLRRDARSQAWTEENRTVALGLDPEANEPSPEVNKALESFDPFSPEKINEENYRFRLVEAIEALPPEQSRIVTMIGRGIPIDSADPYAITIAKTLGKVEKTIRKYRDLAFESIRAALASDDVS